MFITKMCCFYGKSALFIYVQFSSYFQSECQVGLNERAGSDDFLFGTLFFTKATFIFDMDNNQVGLAEMK